MRSPPAPLACVAVAAGPRTCRVPQQRWGGVEPTFSVDIAFQKEACFVRVPQTAGENPVHRCHPRHPRDRVRSLRQAGTARASPPPSVALPSGSSVHASAAEARQVAGSAQVAHIQQWPHTCCSSPPRATASSSAPPRTSSARTSAPSRSPSCARAPSQSCRKQLLPSHRLHPHRLHPLRPSASPPTYIPTYGVTGRPCHAAPSIYSCMMSSALIILPAPHVYTPPPPRPCWLGLANAAAGVAGGKVDALIRGMRGWRAQ